MNLRVLIKSSVLADSFSGTAPEKKWGEVQAYNFFKL